MDIEPWSRSESKVAISTASNYFKTVSNKDRNYEEMFDLMEKALKEKGFSRPLHEIRLFYEGMKSVQSSKSYDVKSNPSLKLENFKNITEDKSKGKDTEKSKVEIGSTCTEESLSKGNNLLCAGNGIATESNIDKKILVIENNSSPAHERMNYSNKIQTDNETEQMQKNMQTTTLGLNQDSVTKSTNKSCRLKDQNQQHIDDGINASSLVSKGLHNNQEVQALTDQNISQTIKKRGRKRQNSMTLISQKEIKVPCRRSKRKSIDLEKPTQHELSPSSTTTFNDTQNTDRSDDYENSVEQLVSTLPNKEVVQETKLLEVDSKIKCSNIEIATGVLLNESKNITNSKSNAYNDDIKPIKSIGKLGNKGSKEPNKPFNLIQDNSDVCMIKDSNTTEISKPDTIIDMNETRRRSTNSQIKPRFAKRESRKGIKCVPKMIKDLTDQLKQTHRQMKKETKKQHLQQEKHWQEIHLQQEKHKEETKKQHLQLEKHLQEIRREHEQLQTWFVEILKQVGHPPSKS